MLSFGLTFLQPLCGNTHCLCQRLLGSKPALTLSPKLANSWLTRKKHPLSMTSCIQTQGSSHFPSHRCPYATLGCITSLLSAPRASFQVLITTSSRDEQFYTDCLSLAFRTLGVFWSKSSNHLWLYNFFSPKKCHTCMQNHAMCLALKCQGA